MLDNPLSGGYTAEQFIEAFNKFSKNYASIVKSGSFTTEMLNSYVEDRISKHLSSAYLYVAQAIVDADIKTLIEESSVVKITDIDIQQIGTICEGNRRIALQFKATKFAGESVQIIIYAENHKELLDVVENTFYPVKDLFTRFMFSKI